MNPIVTATRGKGPLRMLRRAGAIGRRYGLTSGQMDRTLAHFVEVLSQFQCGATFPITAVAVARSRGVVEKYQARGIEFAVHGYYHVDHAQLSLDEQLAHFASARRLFEARGVACRGFRSPYLRWTEHTIAAVRRTGFAYDSSQSLAWNVLDGIESAAYRRVLDFNRAIPASTYPSLPRLEDGLVRIPYSQPDDEALIDRLDLSGDDGLGQPWLAILAESHRLGELFALGLHPERIRLCEAPLVGALQAARALSPGVWMARLDEIAAWWAARAASTVRVDPADGGGLAVRVAGPSGVTLLTRGVETVSPTQDWDGVYRRVEGDEAIVRSERRPFIGVSASSSPRLTEFLRQQGFIVEQAGDDRQHVLHLDRPEFVPEDERPLLARIDQGDFPLVRLGRWPHGARSALCVSGDIDALTVWDYGLRLLGR